MQKCAEVQKYLGLTYQIRTDAHRDHNPGLYR